MYDPLVGRFLSVDNYVQDPSSTQNYNRYSYCLNNPLKYSDPSGWVMLAADQGWDLGHSPTNLVDFGMGDNYGGGIGLIGGGGGWGGNGGVLPGGNTIASNGSNPHNQQMEQESIQQDATRGWRTDDQGQLYNVITGQTGWDNARQDYQETRGQYIQRKGYTGEKGDYSLIGTMWVFTPGNGATGQGDGIKYTLGNFNDGLNAIGISAGSAELFTNANAGARIAYTTINGTSASVSKLNVLSTFTAVGKYVFYGSIVIDLTLGVTGFQDPWTTVQNMGVATFAYNMGGVGIGIGVIYTVLDKTGMFDRPSGPMPIYNPSNNAMPDAIRVAPALIKY